MLKYAFFVAAVVLVAQPALASDGKQDGLRVEARVGYETPTISDGGLYKLGNSASIGAELGYDVKAGAHLLIGPFVNYDYAHASTCATGDCLGSDGNLAAGGRIGYNFNNHVQLYAKVGYDSFRLKASVGGDSATTTLNGAMFALGGTVNVGHNSYVGFEGNYADLGQFAGANFARRHVALIGGVRF